MPLNGGRILTAYGHNNNSFVAIQAPVPNAAVWSAGAGVVADASFTGVNDGHMVIVRHSPIFFTVYTNLREPEVTAGQRIAQGQRLGFLGGSSLQSNDLLKLFVRIEDPQRGGAFVDPVLELGLSSP
jgi:murein DD-endopeptidase MepM/ murein hydrolase activator NlpD